MLGVFSSGALHAYLRAIIGDLQFYAQSIFPLETGVVGSIYALIVPVSPMAKRGNIMTSRLACADFTFPLLPHAKVLQLIAMLEFTGVDIGLFENRSHLWPSREFAQLGQSTQQLRRQLDACGLAAADVFLQLDPDFTPYAINHPEAARRQKARDWFVRTLEYAT